MGWNFTPYRRPPGRVSNPWWGPWPGGYSTLRVAVKIGSNILAGPGGLDHKRMGSIAASVTRIIEMGHEVLMISSGAVAAGMGILGLKSKPREIMLKQAAAAVGQPSLIWHYDRCFKELGRQVAQVLLTRDGLSNRTMYLNSKNTLSALLDFGVIPIINENDTVATDEMKFGDNDRLAALVASLSGCDRLVILSDVDGLYTADPRTDSNARLVESVHEITPEMLGTAGGEGSAVSTGGMYSKLLAAEIAMRSGIVVNIINGKRPELLVSLLSGERHGTEFLPRVERLPARKGWIAFGIRATGKIVIDDGAVRAVTGMNRSLLPSGILGVEGSFQSGSAVYCLDRNGVRVAKGLTNYSSEEIERIRGLKTAQIESALGYKYSDEVIHRDNLVGVNDSGGDCG